ncbi:hypothetical protein ACTQ54_05000 [Fundicoccus sp. Sow4_H7]|uniref:hypothetical protein n=1 Tax=Fundicoccus sp. Sow4_H7 TaxID=3438784 RepID=UPI003F92CCC9
MLFKFKSSSSELNKKFERSKKYSVYEAVELIKNLDNDIKSEQKTADLTVLIWNENQQISADTIKLGEGEGIDYLIYLEKRLFELHKDDMDFESKKKEIEMFINALQEIYAEQYNATLIPESEPKAKREFKNPIIFNKSKVLKMIILPISILLLAFVGYKLFKGDSEETLATENIETSSQITEVASLSEESTYDLTYLDQLLSEKRFEEALQEYPQEYPYIEREIFYLGLDGIPYLETFLQEKSEYLKGQFDLAYLKKEFQTVVELKDQADSDERLTQLAVAYINLNLLNEAEEINDRLQVSKLTEQIETAKNRNLINMIKDGKIEEAKSEQVYLQNPRVTEYFNLLDEANQQIEAIEEQLLQVDLISEEEIESLNKQKEKLIEEINNFFYLF